ncbi:class I SAM-dependent methyltransferase [Gayadomonas joobiniege]|uniref:class I SAM-dependent methyltransferase n=1 Tax=Gayadomonas joobiniege TaxID=1234606 RepID=UPI000376C95A|nr:methyltransferase domain-containing protein [Gayadomonas joobiniege]
MRSTVKAIQYAALVTAGLMISTACWANDSLRTAQNIARDQARHPHQTLAFFELKHSDTVVEVWPGGGWYTEILAAKLHPHGKLYTAHFPTDLDNAFFKRMREQFADKLQTSPVYKNVTLTSFHPASQSPIAPDNSVDKVFTFRNLHNWYMYNGDEAAVAAFKQFYKALKPGGVLGVVDHRLPEHLEQKSHIKSGYIKMSLAISWALQAGFVLEASSEINANTKDTADHASGVWTLPPTLRGLKTAAEKEKYQNIGESDRFTLKFRKPI